MIRQLKPSLVNQLPLRRETKTLNNRKPYGLVQKNSSKISFADLEGLKTGTIRWFQKVEVIPFILSSESDKTQYFKIVLDSREVRTPKGSLLFAPQELLAYSVAIEWDSQIDRIVPGTMPLTNMLINTLDFVQHQPEKIVIDLLKTFATDALSFRAGPREPGLLDLQTKHHDPVIDWFEKKYSIPFKRNLSSDSDISQYFSDKSLQTEESINLVRELFVSNNNFSAWHLAGLFSLSKSSKSLVLALATLEGFLSPEELITASRVEEEFQIQTWGEVVAGHDLDRTNSRIDLLSAAYFSQLLDNSKKYSE